MEMGKLSLVEESSERDVSSPSLGVMPEVSLHCLTCSILCYQEMEKQKKAGKKPHQIMVPNPQPAYTMRIVTVNNMPVSVPTCMGHLFHSDNPSGLAIAN